MRFTGFLAPPYSEEPIQAVLTDASPFRVFPSRVAVTASPRFPCLLVFAGCSPTRPRGLAPLANPLHASPLPVPRARYSLGLPFPVHHVHVVSHPAITSKTLGFQRHTRLANLSTSPNPHRAPDLAGGSRGRRLAAPLHITLGRRVWVRPHGSNILISSGLLLQFAFRRIRTVELIARSRAEAPLRTATRLPTRNASQRRHKDDTRKDKPPNQGQAGLATGSPQYVGAASEHNACLAHHCTIRSR